MIGFLRGFALFLSVALAAPAWAQETVWVQIEARPTEAEALDRAGFYARRLPNVTGYRLNTGWYAVTLGPYSEAEAAARLAQLRSSGAIPADSYLTDGRNFGERFFQLDSVITITPDPAAAETLPEPGEESVTEARARERNLSREARQEVQIALSAGGFYTSVIDADFGPGTRRAMSAWQAANGFETTGVLTTRQRAALLETYRAAVADLGLETVEDREAGVSITLPLGLVAFDRYEPPFAHYEGDGPRALLISQQGDRAGLAALYEVLQTLEIMPLEGPRRLNRTDFTLSGGNDRVVSAAYARVVGDTIKGYLLVWPTGDDYRRQLTLTAMRASFQPIEGVLPETMGAPQSVDLLAGLEFRKPVRASSGFYVSGTGEVLTTAAAVEGCGRIELGSGTDVSVAAKDVTEGLALLRAATALSPMAYARLTEIEPRLQSEVAVAGYSFGGILSLPSVTFGTLADVRSLDGDDSVHRLALGVEPGDAGGPVFDETGAVAGMVLPEASGARVLPEGVAFARDAERLARFLSANGVAPSLSEGGAALAPEDLTVLAADMTVLVTCWE